MALSRRWAAPGGAEWPVGGVESAGGAESPTGGAGGGAPSGPSEVPVRSAGRRVVFRERRVGARRGGHHHCEGGDVRGRGSITSVVVAALEGAATTSSFGGVDDERRRTAGQRKPILDRKRKKTAAANEPWVHSRGTPSAPPPPLSLPRGQHGQKKGAAAGAASCDSGAAARPTLMWGAAGARAWVGRCPAERCWGCRDGVEPPRWRGPPATAEERRGGGAWRPGRSGVAPLQLVPAADLDGRRRNRPVAR